MPHLNNAAWLKSRMQVKVREIVSLPNSRIQRSFKANDDDLEHLGTTIGSTKAIIVVAGIFWNKRRNRRQLLVARRLSTVEVPCPIYGSRVGSASLRLRKWQRVTSVTSLLTREPCKSRSPLAFSLSARSLARIESTKQREMVGAPRFRTQVYGKVEVDDRRLACTHCVTL